MVLVDSSIWIDYFKGNKKAKPLETLINFNVVCINDLILAELLPSIKHKKEFELAKLVEAISKIPLVIDWQEIINMQTLNLKHGINNFGIADLIIAQNALNNDIELYSFDKHFELVKDLHKIKMYRPL